MFQGWKYRRGHVGDRHLSSTEPSSTNSQNSTDRLSTKCCVPIDFHEPGICTNTIHSCVRHVINVSLPQGIRSKVRGCASAANRLVRHFAYPRVVLWIPFSSAGELIASGLVPLVWIELVGLWDVFTQGSAIVEIKPFNSLP